MLNSDDTPVRTRRLAMPGGGCAGGIGVSMHGYEHLHLTHLTGEGRPDGPPDFTAEAESMLARAEECLRRQGLSFRNVIRTWFYLRDMDADYAAFNRVRNRFYAARPIAPLPASTGIQGSVFPSAYRCGMDLYALGGCAPCTLTVMHSPTMNEPSDYRSAFSRGLRLDLTDASFLYVSGTASIDAAGQVAHVDDIDGQVERMLHNVRELLAAQGAGLEQAVSAITYLKSATLLEPFRKVCARHPELQGVVNSVVVAGVCRPEWLCEIELQAVAA
jgi:enamine deaminase RidA (YjgF/YER057c/UK114 family)